MEAINVVITNPRSSVRLPAEVSPGCSAKELLAGLQADTATNSGPFIPPSSEGQPYALVIERSGTQLAPDQTMVGAGVQEGDVLEVQQMGQGAGADGPASC